MKKYLFTFFSLLIFYSCCAQPGFVMADSVSTSVTVGNSAPSFDTGPAESTASTSSDPTNQGSDVTFTATGSDDNAEDYYLIVCTTDAVTATNGDAPTCDVGTWCTSTATTTDTQASCSHTTTSDDGGADKTEAWYAFVCDGNSSAASCSSSSQGTGDTGSPFYVNHPPTFDTISNDGPQDPGSDVTWSTNVSTTDSDTSDQVKLVVCSSSGITAGACDSGALCSSSLVDNDPDCSYTVPNGTDDDSSPFTAYAYLVDTYDMPATGANQGQESSNYSVNNVAPVVSAVTVNSGSDMTLTNEESTTDFVLSGTVTDNNGCSDISTVKGYLYEYQNSVLEYADCDSAGEADGDDCYPELTCSVGGGNSCDGGTDTSASYTCTASVQYYANPTTAGTDHADYTWRDTLKATDDDAANHNYETSATIEMETFLGLKITGSIDYGNISAGNNSGTLDQTTTTTATGNLSIDQEVSGTDMTDGGEGTIEVENQEYDLSVDTSYGSGTDLTDSAVTITDFNCAKTTSSGQGTKTTYWGIAIPEGIPAGEYSGTNTVSAVAN